MVDVLDHLKRLWELANEEIHSAFVDWLVETDISEAKLNGYADKQYIEAVSLFKSDAVSAAATEDIPDPQRIKDNAAKVAERIAGMQS